MIGITALHDLAPCRVDPAFGRTGLPGAYPIDLMGNYFATRAAHAESGIHIFDSLVVLRIVKE